MPLIANKSKTTSVMVDGTLIMNHLQCLDTSPGQVTKRLF
jgi:hypothetical protein